MLLLAAVLLGALLGGALIGYKLLRARLNLDPPADRDSHAGHAGLARPRPA